MQFTIKSDQLARYSRLKSWRQRATLVNLPSNRIAVLDALVPILEIDAGNTLLRTWAPTAFLRRTLRITDQSLGIWNKTWQMRCGTSSDDDHTQSHTHNSHLQQSDSSRLCWMRIRWPSDFLMSCQATPFAKHKSLFSRIPMLPEEIFFKDWSPRETRDVLTTYSAKYSISVLPPMTSRFLKKVENIVSATSGIFRTTSILRRCQSYLK